MISAKLFGLLEIRLQLEVLTRHASCGMLKQDSATLRIVAIHRKLFVCLLIRKAQSLLPVQWMQRRNCGMYKTDTNFLLCR